jgi:hypothetical protein
MEDTIAGKWIYDTLSADSALTADLGTNNIGAANIFENIAEDSANLPYIVYLLASSRDQRVAGLIRLWVDQTWYITLYTDGPDRNRAARIEARIDALLDRATNRTVTGGEILYADRQDSRNTSDTDGGNASIGRLAIYHIRVRTSP